MSILFSLLDSIPAPLWPASLVGWLGWFAFLAALIWLLWVWRAHLPSRETQHIGLLVGLAILVPLTNLFIGLRLPAGEALPLPGIPQEPRGPALMLLGALPILLAGGILGPWVAAGLGLLAGTLRFLWDTHSVFTPLEFAFLAALFSVLVRQRYRTLIFKILREPLAAALAVSLLYLPVFALSAFFTASGSMAARLDYAITRAPLATLAIGGELLMGGLFAQVIALTFPGPWGRHQPLQPSPAERSLEMRFLSGAGTLVFILLFAVLAGDWWVAGSAAREMLENRLRGTARMASQGVPFFLETGQNAITQIAAAPALLEQEGGVLQDTLQQQVRVMPYFDQLLVFDSDSRLLAAHPDAEGSSLVLFPEESAGLELAFNGVLSQVYTIPPAQQGEPARVSFVAALANPATGSVSRVLVGRSNISTNPFAQPMITGLQSMDELGGSGILLDENNRILYHPSPTLVMSSYVGQVFTEEAFFDEAAPNGTRNLVYFQPTVGRNWSVVLAIPAQQAQQLALEIAAPLSVMIIFMALVALVSLRFGLRSVSGSLQNLASEAGRIAQGQLDHSLQVSGVDEVGQLRRAFEQMRVSLQARLDELNRLLLVSQGVASTLELRDAVQPVLDAVIANGAYVVRLVISREVMADELDRSAPVYSQGTQGDYTALDEHISQLARQQDRLVLSNTQRLKLLDERAGPIPASLMAVALRHENRFYGVLWAGYESSRAFSEGDIRFFSTLAGQAALAAANNLLFRSAEVGRQRLAAILASTPDPVLVTDHANRLLLANPAAWQTLGAAVGTGEGKPIEQLIAQKPLLDILQTESPDKLSAEVITGSGQVYLATASPVVAEGRLMGRVCILRDITHFKELDTMKTEFVNTVSHDLRSPLTLMRGYATMLEMVGSLNEQQQGYVQKIIIGVENMSRLVNNLLDLGRIEVGVGLQLERVSILGLVEQATGGLQLQAGEKNITLVVDSSGVGQASMDADSALLQQAMYNLVENAIKYTPRDGRVQVRARVDKETFWFEVSDNGIGIAPADQERLFEKFYRGSQREAREQKGSGLGLAIVKSIAERHGGRVSLKSEVGKGSTFTLQAPLRQP